MHPIQCRMLLLEQILRRAHVGRQHALLDQLVCFVAHHRHDGLDLAMRVELELELDGFEVERAALRARLGEHLVQRVHRFEMRQERLGGLVPGRCRLRYPFPDLGVGEPRARMHHRRVEAVAANFAAAGDCHVADHAQPIDLGLQ